MSPSLHSVREKSSYSPLWLFVPLVLTASVLMAALSVELLTAPPLDEPESEQQDSGIAAEVAHDIRRFALNALLVPVLDDEASPPRWHDPSLAVPCQPGTQIHVNGRPIEPRSVVPGPAFSVLWVMKACLPFGAGGPELTGGAEVVAFHDDDGLSAVVHLRKLHVRHRGQEIVLDTTFAARTP